MQLRASIEHVRLPTRPLPPRAQRLLVEEGGAGYIGGRHPPEPAFLQTSSVLTCVVAYLRRSSEDFTAITHLAGDLDPIEAINRRLIPYLLARDVITAPEFDDTRVLIGPLSSLRLAHRACEGLQLTGVSPRILRAFPFLLNTSLYDTHGTIFLADPLETVALRTLISRRNPGRRLTCENTGEELVNV